MQPEKFRKNIVITVGLSFLLISALFIIFWNSITTGKSSPGFWPFLIYLFIILALGNIINLTLAGLNPKKLKETIEKEISEERMRFLKEFENKEEQKDDQSIKESIEKKKSAILPKGNFKNPESFLEKLLKNVTNELEFVQGIVYIREKKTKDFKFLSGFALTVEEVPSFKIGENLTGQVAESKEITVIDDIPEDYFKIESGLGSTKPKLLYIIPVLVKDNAVAIFELASFKDYDEATKEIVQQVFVDVSDKFEQLTKA
jgi:putative methionine-R-sulfoxide reductase with GAF domain